MKTKTQQVDERFPGLNCAQTVFSLFAEDLNLNEETALKISSGFAGGMTCAETCGAVTGSYMVIGLKHGYTLPDPEEKAKTWARIVDFNKKFKQEHGSLICKELTGYDVSTEEGMAKAREAEVFKEICPAFVKTACRILEEDE